MYLTFSNISGNHFSLAELAIRPLLNPAIQDRQAIADQIVKTGSGNFCDFLVKNELAVLWYDYLETGNIFSSLFSEENRKLLKDAKIKNTALLLNQDKVLGQVHSIFETGNIPYLVFKGASTRQTVYDDPVQRVCSDIDILVPEPLKLEAAKYLVNSGFKLAINPANISHEVSLVSHSATIDLHWNLLRPGRTRINLSEMLLQHRCWNDKFYGLDDKCNLVVMLVHPAITKYVNSPVSLLVHMVDLHLLLHAMADRLNEVISTLDNTGTKTAAWASLYWYRQLTGSNQADALISHLQPGKTRRLYLQYWIDNNLVGRFWTNQGIIKTVFGLLLQDNAVDMFTAVRQRQKEKRAAAIKTQEFENLVNPDSTNPAS